MVALAGARHAQHRRLQRTAVRWCVPAARWRGCDRRCDPAATGRFAVCWSAAATAVAAHRFHCAGRRVRRRSAGTAGNCTARHVGRTRGRRRCSCHGVRRRTQQALDVTCSPAGHYWLAARRWRAGAPTSGLPGRRCIPRLHTAERRWLCIPGAVRVGSRLRTVVSWTPGTRSDRGHVPGPTEPSSSHHSGLAGPRAAPHRTAGSRRPHRAGSPCVCTATTCVRSGLRAAHRRRRGSGS
ncbi:hypothetical protein EV649_7577 [Kribbella sp. VKM Ac-2569]|nr:hypothetical protein EV649_7577 [Kribbella sp. VKM Ac-2569]